jgi:hypothetical protein
MQSDVAMFHRKLSLRPLGACIFDGANHVESILSGSLVVFLCLAVLLNTINECPRKRAGKAKEIDESNMLQPFA